MRQFISPIPDVKSVFPVLMPVTLWALLFLGIGAGSASDIWDPAGPRSFIDGIRSILPFVVAGPSAAFIVFRLIRGYMPARTLFGPLGLASSYGVIGFIAVFNSTDGSVALWWTGLYLSVPVVLWGVVWRSDLLEQLRPLVNATWLAVILAAAVLLAIAVFKLDFVDKLQDPSLFLKCRPGGWIELGSGQIRGTGVGRYAAITALLAISGMWMPKWRRIWSVVLVISLLFLLYTGARGSFVGFGAGAALICILYTISAGRRSIIIGLIVFSVSLPLLWGTGIAEQLLRDCVFRNPVQSPIEPVTSPPPQALVTGLVPEPVEQRVVAQVQQTLETPVEQRVVAQVQQPLETLVATVEARSVQKPEMITTEFYSFSGRQAVWSDGWRLFTDSPVLGYGFQADRLLLGTHMHNSVMHALLQTGVLGTIPFIFAIVLAWILLLRVLLKLKMLLSSDKHLVIQCAGILAFFTMRSFPESTGAFFGVDWLIIAVMLFYIQVVHSRCSPDNPYAV